MPDPGWGWKHDEQTGKKVQMEHHTKASVRVLKTQIERERALINALFNQLHASLDAYGYTSIASKIDAQHHDFALLCEEEDRINASPSS